MWRERGPVSFSAEHRCDHFRLAISWLESRPFVLGVVSYHHVIFIRCAKKPMALNGAVFFLPFFC